MRFVIKLISEKSLCTKWVVACIFQVIVLDNGLLSQVTLYVISKGMVN